MSWPCDEAAVGAFTELKPHLQLPDPDLVTIDDLTIEAISVCTVQIKSWVWQCTSFPAIELRIRDPSLCLIVDGPVESFIRVGCRMAFWKMSRAEVDRHAKQHGYHYPSTLSLFGLIFRLSQEVMGGGVDEALDSLYVRVAEGEDLETELETALLELDDVLDVVDHMDLGRYKEQKTSGESTRNERAGFRHEYYVAARAHRQASSGTGRKRGSSSSHAASSGSKKLVKIDAHTTQRHAKAYIPSKSSIWLSASGRWCGHLKPHKRISARFEDHSSSSQALRCVVQKLWRQACLRDGLKLSEIPFSGIFEEDGDLLV